MTITEQDRAIESAARKLVHNFDSIPQDWMAFVATHIDEDECVAMPMWGTLFKVNMDEGNICKLLTDIETPEEYAEEALKEWQGNNEGETPDEDDEGTIADSARELWSDSNDEDYWLAASEWQTVGDTGILAREFDGQLLLGVNGSSDCFFEAHWIPLYKELGYQWHK